MSAIVGNDVLAPEPGSLEEQYRESAAFRGGIRSDTGHTDALAHRGCQVASGGASTGWMA